MRRILERKTVLLQISRERFADAKVLLRQKRYNGAVYLGGYVIECLLKAAVCVQLRRDTLPGEYRTHELEPLLRSSGLEADLKADQRLASRFYTANIWCVDVRYQGAHVSAAEARDFVEAVQEVQQWIQTRISP
jgi:HEPN domain-containing protein